MGGSSESMACWLGGRWEGGGGRWEVGGLKSAPPAVVGPPGPPGPVGKPVAKPICAVGMGGAEKFLDTGVEATGLNGWPCVPSGIPGGRCEP